MDPAEIAQKMQAQSAEPLPYDSPPEKDRVTMVFDLHHEHRGDRPHSIQLTASEFLETSEEVYSRRTTAGEQWKVIDTGWLESDKVGFICVENLEGKSFQFNPTAEEREAIAKRIVQLGIPGETFCLLIKPGWSQVFLSAAQVPSLRCLSEQAAVRITAFPK